MLYERQIDPIERPAAICPNCHRNTILCEVSVIVAPGNSPAPPGMTAALPWGSNMITGHDKAICNSNGCGWSGKFKEAKDAVEGTVEAISNGRSFRIWVKPSELSS